MAALAARAKSLFLAASDLTDPAERAAYLGRECGGDAELRDRVEALLRAHDAAPLPPAGAADATGAHAPAGLPETADYGDPTARIGAILAGKYKLIEEIGEGGMGSVYMAQQTEPVKRAVAVKVIKAGMDSKAVLARFEAERQALAMMDHPNIARVLDAGTTDGGRPFFVMELVKGVPITQYCDERKLTPRQRLELFVPVCQAIQHAHQKGIIHRDIKPSNVLVAMYDDRPVPKVIDFGVAKAAGQTLTDKTLMTGFGAVVGTPEYMSPEQANLNNVDIDTRSDVYSLGVLLYELLTGTTPVDRKSLGKAALLEILRIVREVEAPKPSHRLSTADALPSVAACRGTEPAKLSKLMKGELDWLVLKALEKDRTRRYDTANGLARDIQRYLADEIVEARPPSTGYRLQKFVRRHKGQVIAASLVLFALLVGIVGTSWGLVEANRARLAERDRAEGERLAKINAQANEKLAGTRLVQVEAEKQKADEEKTIAQSVRDFLQHKLLAQTDTRTQANALLNAGASSSAAKLNPTIRELLDRAAQELAPGKIEESFPKQPLIQAEILQTIGNTYGGIGEHQPAVDFLERSEALRRHHLGPEHPDTLSSMNNLALAYQDAGKRDLALPLYEETLKLRKAKLGPNHPATFGSMNNLAGAFREAGKMALALPLFEETLKLRKAKLGPEHPDTLISMHNLAGAYQEAGKRDLALPLYEETLKLQKAKLGPEHPDTLWSMNNLAGAYQDAGKRDLALPLYEETLKLQKAKLGPEHPHTLITTNNLAAAYWSVKQLDRSIPLFEDTLKHQEAKLGRDHPDTQMTVANLGVNYKDAGRLQEALPLLEEAQRAAKIHPSLRFVGRVLLDAYAQAGEHGKLADLLREQLAEARKALPRDSPQLAGQLAIVGSSLLHTKAFAQAEPLLRECLAIREKTQPDAWSTFNTQSMLGGALLGQKKYADAELLLLAGYEGMKQREKTIPEQGKVWLTEAVERLVQLYEAMDKKDDAAQWRKELEAAKKELPPPMK